MTNFVIYRIALSNKAKEEQYLNYFNGSNDLLEVMKQFYQYLVNEKVEYNIQGKKRILSVSSKIEILEEERCLASILDYGQTGEYSEIRKGDTHKLLHPVNKSDVQIRKLFSLIHVPKNKKYGYAIFEKKANYGVKTIFEKEINKFLKVKGFLDFKLEMTPGLNYNYLSNMIKKGSLKKINLINKEFSVPTQLSLFGFKNRLLEGLDVREFKFKSKTNCKSIKSELYNMFYSDKTINDKLIFRGNLESDEISFVINYKNSSKTFYIRDKERMRSNIDVTNRLDYENEIPSYESMIKVALELIYEIQGFDINNLGKVA